MANRIDVHHHYLPEAYVNAYHDANLTLAKGFFPNWTVEADTAFSISQQISSTIFSLTAPATAFVHGAAANALARSVNEYGALLMSSDPEKYGFFATVPDLCDGLGPVLEEVRYALDELKADGVTLLTRYGNDFHYLGHPDFLPLWDELEKRKAVVYVHPTQLASPTLVNQFLLQPALDFPHETARAAMDLITRNVIRDHPSVKIILSHAGGTLPYIAFRAAVLLPDAHSSNDKSTEEIMQEARSFYFDLALSGNEYQLSLISKFAKPGHLLFGSDFPYTSNRALDKFTNNLDKFEWSAEERKAANWGNALKLFPRFAGVTAEPVRPSRIMERARRSFMASVS
ncbi:hypothetical protein N7G274_000608 [Stereocaulon virgatum]|uniref:6-methylsalicylate decarboxylase n=1 Tax=Stereocaulon virgatum TaxID=373712 RepID=A0ABR4AV56_9LECA